MSKRMPAFQIILPVVYVEIYCFFLPTQVRFKKGKGWGVEKVNVTVLLLPILFFCWLLSLLVLF
jgi:hypothetical protein